MGGQLLLINSASGYLKKLILATGTCNFKKVSLWVDDREAYIYYKGGLPGKGQGEKGTERARETKGRKQRVAL